MNGKFAIRVIVFVVILSMALFLLNSGVSYAMETLSKGKQDVYSDWNSTNDWLIVEASADSVGDGYTYPYGTEIVRRANSFSLSYDKFRQSWGITYIPTSKDHEMQFKLAKFHNNPSDIRFSDVYAFDNSGNGSLPSVVQYSLDTLWSFSMSVFKLPLPSPWQLILKNDGILINYDSDLEGFTINYQSSPELQGCDYLIYINKIDGHYAHGSYWINEDAKAEAGLLVSTGEYYGKKVLSYVNKTGNIINLPDTTKKIINVKGPRGKLHKREIINHIPLTMFSYGIKTCEYNSVAPGLNWIPEDRIDIKLIGDFRILDKNGD